MAFGMGVFGWLRRAAAEAIVAGVGDGLERVRRGDVVADDQAAAAGLEELLRLPAEKSRALPAAKCSPRPK